MGPPSEHGEFEVSLDYMRPCLKNEILGSGYQGPTVSQSRLRLIEHCLHGRLGLEAWKQHHLVQDSSEGLCLPLCWSWSCSRAQERAQHVQVLAMQA